MSKQIARRDFLKTTAASSAAVAGASLTSQLGIAPRAYAAGKEVIKIGLVGCGGRGSGAATNALSVKPNVRLVAAADVFEDRMESSLARLKESFPERCDVPKERRFLGFDAYKKVLESDVDVVLLTTPPGFRPMQFEAAVEAGKHVFMEKPTAVDVPGVRRILAAGQKAKEKRLSVAVGFDFRHEPNHKECVKMIQDGALGEIHHMRAAYNNAGVWVRPRQAGQTEMQYQVRNWYYFNWLSGDHIVEPHVYTLETINWLKGEAHPVRANGMGGRQVRIGKDFGEIFDHHFNEFEYPDGSQLFSQCRQIPSCWDSGYTAYAYGTKGHAVMANQWECAIYPKGKDPIRWPKRSSGYQVEHDDLFASIIEGKPYNEAEFNAMATMTAILGRMATYSGQVVAWDDAFKSSVNLGPERLAWDAEPPVKPGPDGIYPCAVPGVTKPF